MSPHFFKPIVPVVKPDNCQALGLEHGRLFFIAVLAVRVVVRRAIDIDESRVFSEIGEVRTGFMGLIEMLSSFREPEGVGFKEIEEITLQIGVTEALQSFEVFCSWNLHGGSDDVRIPKFNKKVFYQVAVKRWMIGLIVVAEQAVVTGSLAAFLGVLGLSKVSTGIRVKVAKVKSSPGNPAPGFGIFNQLPEDPCSPFGSFIDQEMQAIFLVRQRFGGKF